MILLGASVIAIAITIRLWRKLTTKKCKSTARLDGKTVLIIGGNAGIGQATAIEIAKRGPRLILASRNVDKSNAVRAEIIEKTGNTNIEVRRLDLASLSSVREFCGEFTLTETRLDVLINNAACVMGGSVLTEDGNQFVMQVNHLGPFLLTNLLLDLLKSSAPSRIVVVSSLAHKFGDDHLNPKDLNDLPTFSPTLYSGILLYSVTKLCNLLMVKQLAKQLQGTGVTVNGLHPGGVKTSVWKDLPPILELIGGVLVWPFLISAYDAAQTYLHVAISEELEEISGKYFDNCMVAETSKVADDDEIARIVWESSLKLVKEKKN